MFSPFHWRSPVCCPRDRSIITYYFISSEVFCMSSLLPIKTNIAGVTHKNDDGISRQTYVQDLSAGDILHLKDASSTRFPEAISVHNSFGDMLGYVPADLARDIRSHGYTPEALACIVIFQGRESPSKPYGASIAIGESNDSIVSLLDKSDADLVSTALRIEEEVSSQTAQATKPFSYVQPDYSKYQSGPKGKSAPWGCIIPVVIGFIIGIIIAAASTK